MVKIKQTESGTKMLSSFFRGYAFRIATVLIVSLLLFEFYMYLSISRDRRMSTDKKYVRDYEDLLCSFIHPKERQAESSKGPCPTQGIVTTFKEGGLNNNMWQYANVIASSIATGLDAYIPYCLKESLEEVFVNVTLPLLSEIGHCILPLPDSAPNVDYWMDTGESIVFKSGDLHGDIVMGYLDHIRKQFIFHSSLVDVANIFLRTASRNATGTVTYVGVYITKTSIIVNQEYDDFYPSVQFFVDAMNHFRKELSNPLFIVITDRKAFWEFIFNSKDVYVVDEDSLQYLGQLLTVLAHCNHTILASEELAIWAAILTGGKAIVSLRLSEDFTNLMQIKKDWKYLLNNTQSVIKFLDRIF